MNTTILMLKEYLRDFLRLFAGKIDNFISLLNVYNKPLDILKLYYLKQGFINTRVKMNESNIVITAETVNSAIRLAKVLREFKGYYTFKNEHVCVAFSNDDFCWNIHDILESEPSYQFLKQFLYLRRMGAYAQRELHGFLILLDGIKWFVRESVWQDIAAGPLLSYLHEPYEYSKWFSKVIERVRTFIDVGAYIGGYTIHACKAGVLVYAVEPSTDNYDVLRRNLELNECDAKLFKVAAGDFKGKAEIRLPTIRWGLDSLTLVSSGDVMEVVDVVPLDDIISNIKRPVMVKIDVEGFEEHVLRGMSNLLKSTDYVMIETTKQTHGNVVRYLTSHGFRLIDLHLHKGDTKLWFNSLFVKRYEKG